MFWRHVSNEPFVEGLPSQATGSWFYSSADDLAILLMAAGHDSVDHVVNFVNTKQTMDAVAAKAFSTFFQTNNEMYVLFCILQ